MVKRALGALHSAIQAGHSQIINMSLSLQDVAKMLQLAKQLQNTCHLVGCLSANP